MDILKASLQQQIRDTEATINRLKAEIRHQELESVTLTGSNMHVDQKLYEDLNTFEAFLANTKQSLEALTTRR